MTNVVVTARCASACRFCFARRLPPMDSEISVAQWIQILAGIPTGGEVRLVGGEPTLHPQFAELVRTALGDGFRVTVLTGGPASHDAERVLCELPDERPSVILNLNSAVGRFGADAIRRWARMFGRRLVPGITIDRPEMDVDSLISAIEGVPTAEVLRVGQAHPVLGDGGCATNSRDYPAIGRIVADLARRISQFGMTIALDCGFVRCQFQPEDLRSLVDLGADIRFECRPIVDVMPDGSAVHCLALGRRWRKTCQSTAVDHRERMTAARLPLESFGIHRECSRCVFRDCGECDGGCLVHRLHRLNPAPDLSTILGGVS